MNAIGEGLKVFCNQSIKMIAKLLALLLLSEEK
jgi:hypothetical protein